MVTQMRNGGKKIGESRKESVGSHCDNYFGTIPVTLEENYHFTPPYLINSTYVTPARRSPDMRRTMKSREMPAPSSAVSSSHAAFNIRPSFPITMQPSLNTSMVKKKQTFSTVNMEYSHSNGRVQQPPNHKHQPNSLNFDKNTTGSHDMIIGCTKSSNMGLASEQ